MVVCSAGVAWSADTKRRLLDHMPQATLVDACGSTEGGTYGVSIVHHGDDVSTARFTRAPGTIILDVHGEEAAVGEMGMIAAVTQTSGYYKHPEKTAATFRTIDGERYVVPGDLGRIEPDGSITLLGRGSSVVNTGGEKVHPEEVEDVLKSLPQVVDAIVVGIPDDRLGQAVAAVVQPAPGASAVRARSSRPRCASTSPATRRPAASCSSTRSPARRTARRISRAPAHLAVAG